MYLFQTGHRHAAAAPSQAVSSGEDGDLVPGCASSDGGEVNTDNAKPQHDRALVVVVNNNKGLVKQAGWPAVTKGR